MRIAAYLLIALLLCSLMACASQPKLMKATVEPEEASPGDLLTMSVQFSGTSDDLQAVFLTVREYPSEYPRIELYPTGTSAENLWSEDAEVPWEATPGTYHLDVNAIDKKGKEIVTKGFEDNWAGKAGTIVVKIK